MKTKYIYTKGTTDSGSGYQYFGGANAKGIWKAQSAIWWDSGDMFFGEWKDGDHDGVGINISENGFIVSNFKGWKYNGPCIIVTKDIAIFGSAKDGKLNGPCYTFVEDGECSICQYEDDKLISKKRSRKYPKCYTKFLPKFPGAFRVTKPLEEEHRGKGDDAYDTYGGMKNGHLDGLATTRWGDQSHVGIYRNGQRNGFGMYKWDSGPNYWFAKWKDGERTNEPYISYNTDNQSMSINFYLDDGTNIVYLYCFDGTMQVNTFDENDDCTECLEISKEFVDGPVDDEDDDFDDEVEDGDEADDKEGTLIDLFGQMSKKPKKGSGGKHDLTHHGGTHTDEEDDDDDSSDGKPTRPHEPDDDDEGKGDDFTFPDLEDLLNGDEPSSPKDEGKKKKPSGKKDYEDQLNDMIGLDAVKRQIKRIKAYVIKNKGEDLAINMCFTGNPGTGKTAVARLLAGILYKEGVLEKPTLVEVDRTGLIGQYIGHTGQKTHDAVKEAMGGILFVDEAYALFNGSDDNKDFGHEAVAALLKDMEDYRGKFCVILAGYKEPMAQLLASNPGFQSRIQFNIEFPDYSRDELRDIGKLMLSQRKYEITDDAFEKVLDILDHKSKSKTFANARELRNTLESLLLIQNERTIDDLKNKLIEIVDVDTYCEENKIKLVKAVLDDGEPYSDIDEVREIANDYDDNSWVLNKDMIEEAVVYLQAEYPDGKKAEGSGFIISPDGVCGTCAHCVEGTSKLTAVIKLVTRKGQRITESHETKILAIDHDNDVALFKIKGLNLDMEYFALEKEGTKDPEPLTEVMMAGYPFGGSRLPTISFNEGKVQSVNPDHKGCKIILVDMDGHGGNSGSGVINKKTGRIVGVFSGSLLQPLGQTGSVEEINYYRPVEFVWKLLEKIDH